MEKELLDIYKQFIKIFNKWSFENSEKGKYEYIFLVRIFYNLTDLLLSRNIIEQYGIKNYKVIESGEII